MIGSIGVHRVTAVVTLRLPLSMYFGNANSSARGLRAPKPVTLEDLVTASRCRLTPSVTKIQR